MMGKDSDNENARREFKPKITPMLAAPKDAVITDEELATHTGDNPALPIYVAIMGTVFDVSGNKAYAPGASYNVFAGKDASRALGMMSLKQEDCVAAWEDLPDKEKGVLNDWFTFFQKRYNIVGTTKRMAD